MKRHFLIVAALMLAPVCALAASDMDFTVYRVLGSQWVEVQIDVTTDSDGSVTTEVIKDNDDSTTMELAGYYLASVQYFFGGTAPTGDSDLTILQHSSSGKDILNGVGTDLIDAATNHFIQAKTHDDGTTYQYGPQPIYGPLYIAVANNIVDSATFTIILKFIR